MMGRIGPVLSRLPRDRAVLPASDIPRVRCLEAARSCSRILSVPLWWSLEKSPILPLWLALVVASDHIRITGLSIAPGVRLSWRLTVCRALSSASAADHCPWILRLVGVHDVRPNMRRRGFKRMQKKCFLIFTRYVG